MREETKAIGTGMSFGTVVFLWILALAIVGGGIELSVQSWFTNKQTEITRNTNAYVTSKQSALRDLKAGWDSIEVDLAKYQSDQKNGVDRTDLISSLQAQQNGIVRQMKEEADLIQNPEFLQADIRQFLADHQ